VKKACEDACNSSCQQTQTVLPASEYNSQLAAADELPSSHYNSQLGTSITVYDVATG